MSNKAIVSLTTGLEDAAMVTVALLVAIAAAESGRPTLMFLTREAVRLATEGFATGSAGEGYPPIADLLVRYSTAGGEYFVSPSCFDARKLNAAALIDGAKLAGTEPMWEWIGDGATAFSY
jgi:predicted peroxiredoxin